MPEETKEYLEEMRFGELTVHENLERAIADGSLIKLPDGGLALPQPERVYRSLCVKSIRYMECLFLKGFLFNQAYNQTSVPFGCRNCFKVKVFPQDFRGLIALLDILEKAPYQSKCGAYPYLYNPLSRNSYAGFIYLDGLAAAKIALQDLRATVNAHPSLGKTVPLTIDRGCSHFKDTCGPPDKWTFREEMSKLEDDLFARYRKAPLEPVDYQQRKMAAIAHWIEFARSSGDDTYLELMNMKPQHKSSPYPVEDVADKTAASP